MVASWLKHFTVPWWARAPEKTREAIQQSKCRCSKIELQAINSIQCGKVSSSVEPVVVSIIATHCDSVQSQDHQSIVRNTLIICQLLLEANIHESQLALSCGGDVSLKYCAFDLLNAEGLDGGDLERSCSPWKPCSSRVAAPVGTRLAEVNYELVLMSG